MYWDHITFLKSSSALLGFLAKKQLSSSLGEAVRNWQKKESEPRLPLQVGAKCMLSVCVPCIQTGARRHSPLESCFVLALTGHPWSPQNLAVLISSYLWIFHSHTYMLCCFGRKEFKQEIRHLFGGTLPETGSFCSHCAGEFPSSVFLVFLLP